MIPIRVLVVDDSNFFRKQIQQFIEQDPRLAVVGTAIDGRDAIEKARSLSPDIITMDIEMPVMNGIEATRKIMRHRSLPILIFSSLSTEGAQATFDALDAGAVDYIPKRFEDISRNRDKVQKILCEKIALLAKQGAPSLRSQSIHKAIIMGGGKTASAKAAGINKSYKLLAIGTSTGGPVALQEILTKLPENFPLPILMIQHMPGTFTPTFAARLDQTCDIHVKEAASGDLLKPGVAYLAPGGKQMTVRGSTIAVTEGDSSLTYKPSLDVTFSSLAESFKDQVLAIILTGMGADGCAGAKKLKNAGSTIWAQDKASCVIYGMPLAVFDAGITDKVLSLKDVAPQIMKHV